MANLVSSLLTVFIAKSQISIALKIFKQHLKAADIIRLTCQFVIK